MAYPRRDIARLSPKNRAQLEADLATGAPIFYARTPGTKHGAKDAYYNPQTGQVVSEDYVLRVYRPYLSEAETALRLEHAKVQRLSAGNLRRSMAETWLIRQQYLARHNFPADPQTGEILTPERRAWISTATIRNVLHDPMFDEAYARLAYIKRVRLSHKTALPQEWNTSRAVAIKEPITGPADIMILRPGKLEYMEPGGPMADALVVLGRRLPDEPFFVGDSPSGPNHEPIYIQEYVLPVYMN